MPSPFPGMDPWLESPALFPDLHTSLATYLRAALTKVLPRPFYAAVATRIYMEESDRRTEPDMDVLRPAGGPAAGGTLTAARPRAGVYELPARPWPDEEITEAFVEVKTTHGDERLVTSIEVLSPTNKTRGTNGRGMYLAKQQEMRAGRVNLVEIDLLRAGTHATAAPLAEMRQQIGAYDYHVAVSRGDRPDVCFVTPIRLDQPLPTIDIPLTPAAGTVPVDLQAVFTRCYEEAAYELRARYKDPCDPPLTPDQQAWADGLLRAKGLRS
jgi:hypothetical protein